jgi:5,10-methylenetetrahydromethanopterin reductase
MIISCGLDTTRSIEHSLEQARELRERGLTNLWSSQIFGPDTLTVLAIIGRELPELNLGTAVIPIQPRHPSMLAAQARTVQSAIGGALSLGIGLSHQVVVEGLWGISFDKPAQYMREYLDALAPMLRGEKVSVKGDRVSMNSPGVVGPKDVRTPSLLVAALGPVMLRATGRLADGTCLWLTGPQTIKSHVAPTIIAAALEAGKPAPRIVAALPITVTSDISGARERTNEALAVYGTLPSYRAMMDREGAPTPADVALIGSREQVTDMIGALSDAGATEFSANPSGNSDEVQATLELLSDLAKA